MVCKRMKPVIFLDMDGACCDYPRAVIDKHGRDPDEVLAAWAREHRGKPDGYKIIGLSATLFWNAADHKEESFWANIEEYPWFRSLYDGLSALAPVLFLSSAGDNPRALSGKLKWLQARFGEGFQDYVFTLHKHQLARENAVLVDDYEVFVEMFREAGGKGVLFPQTWGSNHHIEDKIDYTLKEVAAHLHAANRCGSA